MSHSSKEPPRSKHPSNSHSDPALPTMSSDGEIDYTTRESSFSGYGNSYVEDQGRLSTENMSPMMMSPWNQVSPFTKSPWSSNNLDDDDPSLGGSSNNNQTHSLIGSLVREEGHIYSLATRGDLLYTGSDSKNIRVWKNLKEFSGFKSASGLVKAIVIMGGRIFTGHQDGKIRVWKVSPKKPNVHKRYGSLPTFKDILKASIKPSSYVEVKRHRSTLYLKHSDAISCLSLSDDQKLLYSASWDKTFKVWRITDSKCLESVVAHDDAVNAVVASAEGLVFTGSADGSVKVWRREMQGKGAKHFFMQTLLKHECAVTSLAVNPDSTLVYCGSSDGVINYWEREKNLAHGGVLKGHKLAVLCLVARDNVVFSGSADKTIYVWRRDGTDHACMSVLTGHGGPVKCLAVEDDKEAKGKRYIVYSGSLDKSIKVWGVSEQEHTSQRQHVVDQSDSAPGSLRSTHSTS